MNLPHVTIIIPVKDGEKTIAQCLKHLSSLDYPAFDILVVDNGSTDSTRRIVEELKIPLLIEPVASRGRARNVGWKSSSSDWIAFVDVDCFVSKDWLSKLMESALQWKADILQGPIIAQGDHHSPLEAFRQFRQKFKTRNSYTWLTTINHQSPLLNGAALLVKKDCLIKTHGFDEALIRHQDIDFGRRAFHLGADVLFVRDALAHVIWAQGSWVNYFKRSYEVGYLKGLYNKKWGIQKDLYWALKSLVKNVWSYALRGIKENDSNWFILALDEFLISLGEMMTPYQGSRPFKQVEKELSFLILDKDMVVYRSQTKQWIKLDMVSGQILRSLSGKIEKNDLLDRLQIPREFMMEMEQALLDTFGENLK